MIIRRSSSVKVQEIASTIKRTGNARLMIKESHTREIASGIPNAELTIIKGDHFIANKRSVEFNRTVDIFLKMLPK